VQNWLSGDYFTASVDRDAPQAELRSAPMINLEKTRYRGSAPMINLEKTRYRGSAPVLTLVD
jgi:hypothetical protein